MPDCLNCTEKCPQTERAHKTAQGRMYATQELVALVKKMEAGELVEVVRCIKCRNAEMHALLQTTISSVFLNPVGKSILTTTSAQRENQEMNNIHRIYREFYQLYLERQKSEMEEKICALLPQEEWEKVKKKCTEFSLLCPIPAEADIKALGVAESLMEIGLGADEVARDLTRLINMMEEEKDAYLRLLSADLRSRVDFAGDSIRNIGAESEGKETDSSVQGTKGRKSYNPRLTKAVRNGARNRQSGICGFGGCCRRFHPNRLR